MVEESQTVAALSKKLKSALEGLLATGDWSSSPFLQTNAVKIRDLIAKADELSHIGELATNMTTAVAGRSDIMADKSKNTMEGYSQVFILLYQVDGANLQSWQRNIWTLVDNIAARPVYKVEGDVNEFVRSKEGAVVERYGYVVVNVKNEDFYQIEPQLDPLGHKMFALKEDAIKLANIVFFVHANKNRYVLRDKELVLQN